jgi:hypothetical protein
VNHNWGVGAGIATLHLGHIYTSLGSVHRVLLSRLRKGIQEKEAFCIGYYIRRQTEHCTAVGHPPKMSLSFQLKTVNLQTDTKHLNITHPLWQHVDMLLVSSITPVYDLLSFA